MSIVLILLGITGIVFGIRAYRGVSQNWALRSGFQHCAGFAALYLGIAFILMGSYLFLPHGTIPVPVLFAVWTPIAAVGIIGILWLPKFMLPTWFIEGREQRRQVERANRALRKSAREQRRESTRP